MRRDAKFVAAKKDLEDTRTARVTADAYYGTSVEAANIALTYAYWLHRFDPYTYRYTYNPYDYSYGYSGIGYGVSLNYGGYGFGYAYPFGYANRTVMNNNPNRRGFGLR